MELSPEMQKQLEEQKKQCPFCKIVAGETESKQVYEDALLLGILDINPCTKGHVLLMPKEHYPLLPFLPPSVFKHVFGMLPQLCGAVQKALVSSGVTLMIPNGGVAGQRSQHFLMHLLPRDTGDKLPFSFEAKAIDQDAKKDAWELFQQQVPAIMQKYLPQFTKDLLGVEAEQVAYEGTLLHEDAFLLAVIPKHQQAAGHVAFLPKWKDFSTMPAGLSAYLFTVASVSASSIFEGFQAHGTNIILKVGETDDHSGVAAVHVIPRYDGDGLNYLCEPKQPKPDVDSVQGRIKNETFLIQERLKPKKKTEEVDVRHLQREENLVEEKGEDAIEKAMKELQD